MRKELSQFISLKKRADEIDKGFILDYNKIQHKLKMRKARHEKEMSHLYKLLKEYKDKIDENNKK